MTSTYLLQLYVNKYAVVLFACSVYETPRLPLPGGTTGSQTYTTIQQPATRELLANTSSPDDTSNDDYLTILTGTGTGDDGYEIPMKNYIHVTASPPRVHAYENVPKNPRGLNNHASNRLG